MNGPMGLYKVVLIMGLAETFYSPPPPSRPLLVAYQYITYPTHLSSRDFQETAWGEEVYQGVRDGRGRLDSAHYRTAIVTLEHAHHHRILGVAGAVLVHLHWFRGCMTSPHRRVFPKTLCHHFGIPHTYEIGLSPFTLSWNSVSSL